MNGYILASREKKKKCLLSVYFTNAYDTFCDIWLLTRNRWRITDSLSSPNIDNILLDQLWQNRNIIYFFHSFFMENEIHSKFIVMYAINGLKYRKCWLDKDKNVAVWLLAYDSRHNDILNKLCFKRGAMPQYITKQIARLTLGIR